MQSTAFFIFLSQLLVCTRGLVLIPSGTRQLNQGYRHKLSISTSLRNEHNLKKSLILRSTENREEESRLPWYFDPGTYGGVIVLTTIALVVPFLLYAALLQFGLDPNQTGVALSGIFVVGATVLWTLSYVFRVFTKQMTYGQQLKQYEDAVIQKRFEELEDDEVEALLSDIEREDACFYHFL